MKSAQSRLSQKRLHNEMIYENETTGHLTKTNGMCIFIDCSTQALGRVASQIANILNNKYDIDFSRHEKHAYKIVLYNYSKFILTGNKMDDKFYVKYTGYAGGQRTMHAIDIYDKNPRTFFELVISRMLNKNRSRQSKLNNIMYCAELPDDKLMSRRNNEHPVQKAINAMMEQK